MRFCFLRESYGLWKSQAAGEGIKKTVIVPLSSVDNEKNE